MQPRIVGESALDLTQLEDGTLMAWVVEGRPGALEAIYDRYADLVYSLALRVLGEREAARELVRGAFVQLARNPASMARRGSSQRALLALVRELALAELRGRPARLQPIEALETEDPGDGLGREAHEGDDWGGPRRARILEALAALSIKQRQAVELAYFRGFTQEEIAALTGEPLNTIQSRLRLSLRRLREVLHPEDLEVRRS